MGVGILWNDRTPPGPYFSQERDEHMQRNALIVGLALVAVAASFVIWRAASDSTRTVTGTWVAGVSGLWHNNPEGVLEVKGLSDVGTDCTIELAVQDATGKFLSTFGATNDAATPFDLGDPVLLRSGLDGYGTGQTFILTGTFKDSTGAVAATVSSSFTKP